MHWIVMVTPEEKAGCTANAIGPHALLTAQHCDLPGAVLHIDGLPFDFPVVEKEYDGHDHMILIVGGVTFKDRIGYNVQPPSMGEHVHLWGNPRGIRDQYREGLYAGQMELQGDDVLVKDAPVDMFVMSIQPGDSGSAILNDDGQIVGIVTYGVFGGMFGGSYRLQFSKDQIKRARAS